MSRVEFYTGHATHIIGSMIANGIVYYLLYDTRYNYTLSAHFQASLIFDISLHFRIVPPHVHVSYVYTCNGDLLRRTSCNSPPATAAGRKQRAFARLRPIVLFAF